ncbi:hypothetical protein [Paraburkholderia atlantica]|nr:hypothetical protein [Paraburkholderia atlantica]
MSFDVATACLAVTSAALWLASSRVNFTFGWDMDQALDKQMKLASKLNAAAASVAALAAVAQAAKTFFVG